MPSSAPPFFDAIANRYERSYALDRDESRERMNAVIGALGDVGPRLLDLGVGTGRELSSLQDAGFSIVGMDSSPRMIALCNRRARPIPIVCGDIFEGLPFDEGAFDGALALHGTLSHAPNDGAIASLARELHRVLKSGGIFVFEVPTPVWLATLDDHIIDEERGMAIRRLGPCHFEHRDEATGAAIEIFVRTFGEWRAIFEPWFHVREEAIGACEARIMCTSKSCKPVIA